MIINNSDIQKHHYELIVSSVVLKVLKLEYIVCKKVESARKIVTTCELFCMYFPQVETLETILHRCTLFVFPCSCYLSVGGSQTTHLACLSLSYITTDQPRSVCRPDCDEILRVTYDVRRDEIMFTVQTAWRKNQPDAQRTDSSSLAPFTKTPFPPNLFSWLLLLGDKCVGIRTLLPQREKDGDFKRRGLRLRPVPADITNQISCLGTCNVSLPSGILIITHTKPPHQSNWILGRKLNVSEAINSAVALFSQNTNGGGGECQPSFLDFCEEACEWGRRLQGKWKSLKGNFLPGARTM